MLAVPLVVTWVALREPRWFTYVDLGQTEMRVRDISSLHFPLTSLGARIEAYGTHAQHPGPLALYAMWPVYTLLGADGWSLQAALVVLNLVAIGLCLWVARRRGGMFGVLAVGAVLALLVRGYGPTLMAQPWLPHIPLLWWMLFLLAVWSVLDDDTAMLPLAVLAGSLCAQTHVGYVPLVLGVGSLAVGAVARRWSRRRRDAEDTGDPVPWVIGSAALGAVLWLPPLVQQLTTSPGNLTILVEGFRHPTRERVPFASALNAWLSQSSVWELLSTRREHLGHRVGGGAFLALWAASAVLAHRLRQRMTVRLHLVAAAAATAGLVATSRIFGLQYVYVTYWQWGVTALMLLAVVWTLGARALAAGRDVEPRIALAAAAVTLSALFTVDATGASMPNMQISNSIRLLTAPTVDALAEDPAGCEDTCTYVVDWTWSDMGAVGDGLRLALEREGIDARAPANRVTSRALGEHRTIDPADADALIAVAVGDDAIEEMTASRPLARVVAEAHPAGAERSLVLVEDVRPVATSVGQR